MAFTEVLLIKPVDGLGAEGEQVRVRAGFARNYLLPQGIALPVNRSNTKYVEALKKAREVRESRDLEAANVTATKLAAKPMASLRATKAVMKMGQVGLKAIMDEELKLFGALLRGPAAKEAIGAVMEFRIARHVPSVDMPGYVYDAFRYADRDQSVVPAKLTEQIPIVAPVRERIIEFKRGASDPTDNEFGACFPSCPEGRENPWGIRINGEETHSLNANRVSMLVPRPGGRFIFGRLLGREDGKLRTRDAQANILKGITRGTLMEILEEDGLELDERPFSVDEAKEAKEAFFTAAGAACPCAMEP